MSAKRDAHTREEWISIFEAALHGKRVDSEDGHFMRELKMPLDAYFAVMEALRQGRWRDAKDPRAYVKTVARREVLKAQLIYAKEHPEIVLEPAAGSGISFEGLLERTSFERDTADAMKDFDGVWRPGGGGESAYGERFDENERGQPLSLRGRLRAKLPSALLSEPEAPFANLDDEEEDTNWRHVPIRVDMVKWAKLAGFDEWEMRVLRCQLAEMSREKALASQPDDAARKALQAAWKRYDRTGKSRLRLAAKKLAK